MATITRVFLTLLIGICGVALPHEADALDMRVFGSLGAANARPTTPYAQWGGVGKLGLDASLSDFWGVWGGVEGAYHFQRSGTDPQTPARTTADLFVGLRYNFDVFAYVPYIGVSAVAYALSPPVGAPDSNAVSPGAGAKLTLGLMRRVRREFSWGANIEVHGATPALSDFGVWATLALEVSYHWRH